VEAHHERFHDQHLVRRRPQPLGLCGGQRDRLFAQHVLARLGRFHGQRDVQVVRERVVHGLNLRIRQQLLVGAVGLRDAEGAGGGACRGERAGGESPDLKPVALQHAGQHSLESDFRSAQYAPDDPLHAASPCPATPSAAQSRPLLPPGPPGAHSGGVSGEPGRDVKVEVEGEGE